ncbi:MAG: nucleoside kinase [Bacteroidales bacterium]|nr:nucleoside kinase [Bacteroidales bacterium]
MKQIEIVIENTNERIKVDCGTDLKEIAPRYSECCQYPILGATVNNVVQHLGYTIYTPKSIRFFDLSSKFGYRMYTDSLTLMLFKAVRDLYPTLTLRVEHSMPGGFYCRLFDGDKPLVNNAQECRLNSVCQDVKKRMQELQKADLPFRNLTMLLGDARKLIADADIPATNAVFRGLRQLYITIQQLDGTTHKLASWPVLSTGLLTCWDLHVYHEGMLLATPNRNNPTQLLPQKETPKLFSIFKEYQDWCNLLKVPTIADLNRIVMDGNESHLIHVSEALQEKKFATIADAIYRRRSEVKVVLIAGPSSSGKTTSCRRLSVQLSVMGFDVQQLSVDDYFVDREQTPRQPNGDYDFEALEAVNVELLNDHLLRLFRGERVEIPTYDFKRGTPFYDGRSLQLGPNSILVMEGIHCLNPKLTPYIEDKLKFKIYVSALTQLAIDDLNIIHTSDTRLLRRIVRDNNFRNYSALNTLRRWDSVTAGEQLHIFPYQENADIMFNSALLYELGILKHYAEPLLKDVTEDVPEYAVAHRLLNFLELICPIKPSIIHPASIMREFLGGSSFSY